MLAAVALQDLHGQNDIPTSECPSLRNRQTEEILLLA
jgi:hypothetical protein